MDDQWVIEPPALTASGFRENRYCHVGIKEAACTYGVPELGSAVGFKRF